MKELLRIDLIAAVPEIFSSVLNSSILRIAQEKGIVSIFSHNLHDYADDKFRHIDDKPFGGGAGMLIKCKPVFLCIEKLMSEKYTSGEDIGGAEAALRRSLVRLKVAERRKKRSPRI